MRNAVEGPDYFFLKCFKANLRPSLSSAGCRAPRAHSSSNAANLQLFFPRDRIANITKVGAIDKVRTVIIVCEAGNFSASVLRNTHEQIASHADVKRGARLVAHHVDPIIVIFDRVVRSFDSAALRSE